MSPQQTSTKGYARPFQLLDVERVCEKKPDSAVTNGRSVIPSHVLVTLCGLLFHRQYLQLCHPE